MMLDFLCIGAQKCGTTLLYEHFKGVADLFLPSKKEIHYFDLDNNYKNGPAWYFKYFKNARDDQAKGEITPSYLFFHSVPERIKALFGNEIKFIVLLRSPVDRAYSHYNMSLLTHKSEHLTFEQALIYENYRMETCFERLSFSYLARGFYSEQILNYFKYFDKKQFKFIIFEDFVKDQNKYINEVLFFLGIKKQVDVLNKGVFQNQYPPMQNQTREILNHIYCDEIDMLESLINVDLNHWREF